MPQIILKQPGQPVADFSAYGSHVTVAGVVIDCAARQLDSAVCVEIRANATGAAEGGSGAYLAQIDIPARRYTDEPSVNEAGEPAAEPQPRPLDPNAVAVTLWPAV